MSAHLLIPPTSLAATLTWDSGPRNTTIVTSDGNWSLTDCNWTPDGGFHNIPWPISTFKSATLTGASNLTTSGTLNVNDLDLSNGSCTISGSGTLNFASTCTISNGSTDDTISCIISGASTSLTKTGTGILSFNNTGNTFSGNIIVSAGTLKGVGSVQSTTGCFGPDNQTATKIQIQSGAVFDNAGMTNGGVTDIRYGLTLSGTGILGSCWINTGGISTTNVQTPNIALSGNASIGSITGATGNIALLATGYGLTNLTLNTFALTKIGSNRLYLINTTIAKTGTLTQTDITISGGTISADTNGTLSAGGIGITLSNTAGVTLALNRSATIGAVVVAGTNASLTCASTFTLTVGNSSAVDSIIRQMSGAGGLIKTGSSTLKLFANTYTGPTTLGGTGYIRIGNTNTPFSTSAVTVTANATLAPDIDAGSTITLSNAFTINTSVTFWIDGGYFPLIISGIISGSGSLSGWSSGSISLTNTGNTCTGTLSPSPVAGSTMTISSWAGNISLTAGNLVIANTMTSGNLVTSVNTGVVTINSGVTWTVTKSTNGGIANNITGTGNFVKIGASELRITGPWTLSGSTTVNAGTLCGSSTTTSIVTVNSGGIIGGGNAVAGNLTVAGLIMNTGATIRVLIGSATSIASITVNGSITLNNNVPNFGAGSLNAGTYTLMTYTGTCTGTLGTPNLASTGRTFVSYSYTGGIVSITLS